jgi:hypothetical protein
MGEGLLMEEQTLCLTEKISPAQSLHWGGRSDLTFCPPWRRKNPVHMIFGMLLNFVHFWIDAITWNNLSLDFFCKSKIIRYCHFSVCEPPGLKPGHLTVYHHVELVPDST